MVSHGFSGVRLVARDGSVVEQTCQGYADVTAEVDWTPQTRSQIASISKQFAAAVTLILADQVAVALDDSVARVLPECPAQWNDVSMRHLLTHTSGMTHWGDAPGFDPAAPLDPAERLTRLLAAPLADRPGRTWRYSSPGYLVLSAVLEEAAGRPYAQLVHELVIDRLGLTRTTVGESRESGAAHGYRGGAPVAAWQLHTMPGTGDVWSTAADLACFLTSLHGGGLLPERMRSVLRDVSVSMGRAADLAARIATSRYGLGHFRGTVDGRCAYLHPGDNPGYQSLAAWLPATGTVVVALSNDEADDIDVAVADLALRTAT